jgi:hypothetical protein
MIVFGTFWTLFSCAFVWAGLMATWRGVSQSAWDKVPCVIERFEIRADQKKNPVFEVDLKFSYKWQGQSYTGDKLRPGIRGDDNDYEKLSEVREKLLAEARRDKPEGLTTACLVDPQHPESASLLPPSGAGWLGLILVAFGGSFMLLGISIIWNGLKSRSQKALSDQASQAPFSMVIFFGIFAVAGLGVTFGVVIPGAMRYFAAQSWVETPATVIWSRVKSHSGESTTYSADLFYRYQFEGRTYCSNGYKLMSGSSSGRDKKQEIVNAHPPKSALTCYVNPHKPWQAVVDRDFGSGILFALFPLPFLGIGIGGMVWAMKKKRAEKARLVDPISSSKATRSEPLVADLPERILSAGKSRWINLFAALFVCAFWNGIVSVFVGIAWSAWKKGNPETFLMIFLIPSVLIGTFFLLNVPYRLLMVFLARYELRLAPGTLKPGGTATLTWKRIGGFGQPKSIALRLSGSERATSQNGKNSSTATSVFHDELLAELSLNSISANRPVAIKLSENATPSFKGESNKLVWKLRMDITLPGFPKITDEYEIDVRPLRRDELNP